jgi:hypothetical protein
MKATLKGSVLAVGLVTLIAASCDRNDNRSDTRGTEPQAEPRSANAPAAADQRRAEENRGEPRTIGGGPTEPRPMGGGATEPRPIGGGPTESTAGAPSMTAPAAALAKIAVARCDREVRCKNVGPKQKYLTHSECVTKTQNDKRDDINASDCPRGIEEHALAKCLDAIRSEDCGNPLDTIGRVNACRTGNLCVQ